MTQTAVEWLYDNLKSHFEHDGDLLEVVQFSFEQAKEMEKRQQGYSEEEVYHILCEHTAELFKGSKMTLTEWFNKFKKK